jgi:beta-lactamase class A
VGKRKMIRQGGQLLAAILFVKRRYKQMVVLLIGLSLELCVLCVVVQIVYPRDRALPGTRLAGASVAFENKAAVTGALQRLDKQSFVVQLGSKKYRVTPQSAGLSFANTVDTRQVLGYPTLQRLLPFSLFFQGKASIQDKLRVRSDQVSFQKFASKLTTESNVQPIEGVIDVQSGHVTEHPPQPGIQFTPTEVTAVLEKLSGKLPSSIVIAGQPIAPNYDAAAVHTAAVQANDLIKPFAIIIGTTTTTVSADTVGSWLTFTPNPTTKDIAVGIAKPAVTGYVNGIAKSFYRLPTTTVVTLLDNQPLSQQTGIQGSQLDTTATATAIITALSNKQTTATVALSPISSPVSYVDTYSATSAGLQAVLNNWLAANANVQWGISIAEVDGKNRSAGYHADTSFEPASIYKLYVSYTVQSQIAAGTLDANTITSTGQSIATCLDVMIINSDNPCAQALGTMVGWNAVTADAHAAGFSNTNLSANITSSTANDTTSYLGKLAHGSLMDGTQTTALINRMKRQIYRQGLPAGSSGATVADKVGFYSNYLHDAGIIYYPNGTYVISVFSSGGSWSQIANLAKTVSDYMNSH